MGSSTGKTKVQSSYTNNVFFIVIIVAIIVLTTVSINGNKNKLTWKEEFEQFDRARYLINNQRAPEAEPLLASLLEKEKYKKSVSVVWTYGVCQASIGDFEKAKTYLYMAQQLRGMLLLDYTYAVQVGEVLYRKGEFAEAQKYLLLSTEIDSNGQFTEHVNNMLSDIDKNINAN